MTRSTREQVEQVLRLVDGEGGHASAVHAVLAAEVRALREDNLHLRDSEKLAGKTVCELEAEIARLRTELELFMQAPIPPAGAFAGAKLHHVNAAREPDVEDFMRGVAALRKAARGLLSSCAAPRAEYEALSEALKPFEEP